jgi:hypothetical protein
MHHQFQLIYLWQIDRHIIGALVVALVFVVCKDSQIVEPNCHNCLMKLMVCVRLTQLMFFRMHGNWKGTLGNKMAQVMVVLMTHYHLHLVWYTWKSAIGQDWTRWLSPPSIHRMSSNIYIGYRNSLINFSPQLVLVSQVLIHNLCLISVILSDLCNNVFQHSLNYRSAVEVSACEVLYIGFKTQHQIFLSSLSLALTK